MIAIEQNPFVRARFNLTKPSKVESVRSIVDLILFNARTNPNHYFCLQAEEKADEEGSSANGSSWNVRKITFKDLYHALKACYSWLHAAGVGVQKSSSGKASPVAVYLESDVSLFLYVAALSALNCSVVLLSARLSSKSVNHLLKETGASHVLVSNRTSQVIKQDAPNNVKFTTIASYSHFLPKAISSEDKDADLSWSPEIVYDDKDIDVLILHSSGTTGLPKPIKQGHRYLLGYAGCHEFPEDVAPTWPNLSTLPLYHGFGMLAPSLSLSIGMCCCFPPASTIPGAQSTVELLSLFQARSLMSVPSIMEDIIHLPTSERDEALAALAKLNFLAVGGGPLMLNIAEQLAGASISLLNHYGATEIGAIGPIFVPKEEYDWRYIRLRKDIGLELRPVELDPSTSGPERFNLVGFPFGWGKQFEIQDEIEKRQNEGSQHTDIRVVGRRDDVIVLKTGEKISPKLIEDRLAHDTLVKSAICLGQGSFELLVLIEPAQAAGADEQSIKDHVWNLITEINPTLDSHSRISSKEAIIVKSPEKPIRRSDKGSVMRKEVHQTFENEIKEAQRKIESESYGKELLANPSNIEENILKVIDSIMTDKLQGEPLSLDQDLFERGMDSLEATRLARALVFLFSSLTPTNKPHITKDFIYRHSSIRKLVNAYNEIASSGKATIVHTPVNRVDEINSLANEYISAIPRREQHVLLTGSSGNLGIHFLSRLALSKSITRITCLFRRTSTPTSPASLRTRLESALTSADLTLPAAAWSKIQLVAADMPAARLGLPDAAYAALARSVTHIVHLAWPMDFNRPLASYRPQLAGLHQLLVLAQGVAAAQPRTRPRLLFASSISVVRHYADVKGGSVVPEEPLKEPRVSARIGYAEAKWICEGMVARAQETLGGAGGFEGVVVRIGQLSGPERAGSGVWKTGEHVPALVRAAQRVGAFPVLEGDFSWLPVDVAARALLDTTLSPTTPPLYLHLENPIRQPMADLGTIVAHTLNLKDGKIPFNDWLERVSKDNGDGDSSLMEFFQNDFKTLANGAVKLDTTKMRGVSRELRATSGLSKDLIVEYVNRWREMGFLE